jgi:hypothetical protein
LISGLLSCPFFKTFAPGMIFSLSLGFVLWLFNILENSWRIPLMLAATALAYPIAMMTAMGLQMRVPVIVPRAELWDMGTAEPPVALALLAGGIAGGLLVSATLAICCRRAGASALRIILFGTLAGGLFAFAGWVFRSSIGVAMWQMLHSVGWLPGDTGPRMYFHDEYDYSEAVRICSVLVTWQTGMAATVSLLFREAISKYSAGDADSI